MFNFDSKFFIKHQVRLLKVANSKWLRWILGLNRLPKELKGKHIDKITPNSIHHIIETKLTKKGKFKKQKITAEFFTRPRFAEALAYNLSPFCYFQELRSQKFSWRFSPAGLAYILLFGLLGKCAGLPFAFIGTVTDYYDNGTGDGSINTSPAQAVWADARDAATGAVQNTSILYVGCEHYPNYAIYRLFFPVDTSGLGSPAVITAASFNAKGYSKHSDIGGTYGYMCIVQTSQADPTALASGDYDSMGTTEAHETDQRVTFSGMSTVAYSVFTFNSTGIGFINKTGYTLLGMRSGWDNTNNSYSSNPNVYDENQWNMAESASEPYLSVTYTGPLTLSLTETVALTDALSKTDQKKLTDNPALADSMGKQATTTRSDSLSLSDLIIKNFSKILTQTATSLADVLRRDDQKGLSETIALADAIKKDNQARLSDTINLSDVIASDPRIVLAEILSLTDRLPVLTINKFLTDSNALADQIGERQAGKGVADSVALADAQRFDGQKEITDNLALSDVLTSIAEFTTALAESLAISDNLMPQVAYQRALSENLAVIDDIIAQIIINLALSENLAFSEAMAFTAGKAVSDTITLTDALNSLKQFFISITENPAAGDQLITQVEKILADRTSLADSLVSASALIRNIAEAVALSEAIRFGVETSIPEIIALTDNLRKTTGKNIGENIMVVEVLSAEHAAFVNLSDNITLSDIVSGQVVYNVTIMDSLQVAELLIKEYNKNILEAIAIADSIATLQKERAYKKTIVVSQKKDKIVLLTNAQ